jgi:peptide deformylase
MNYSIVTGVESAILRKKALPIEDPLHPDIQRLIPDMFASMHQANGIGLAAPQIGLSIRLAVIEIDTQKLVLINPILDTEGQERILFEEGCLSLPGQFLAIERYETVTVKYQDKHGTDQTLTTSGLLAIAIQHEIDHLDGILIVDRYDESLLKHYAL